MSKINVYAKYELLRLFRNKQFLIFTLVFPLVMFFLIAAPNRNAKGFGATADNPAGVYAPQYYMVGLLAWGAMFAAIAGSTRIATERQTGWIRQLRLTPLSPRMYFRTKIATTYAMVVLAMLLLYVCGLILDVRIPVGEWFQMSLMVLLAAIPFAALGIALGHLFTPDAAGPASGGGTALFAFLGGTWFPIVGHGVLVDLCKLLPSYWLVQAGHVGLGAHAHGNPWGTEGWAVIAVWSAATILLARWAYRRDTYRV